MRNVSGFGSPRRHGAKTRRDDEQDVVGGRVGGLFARLAIAEQGRQLGFEGFGRNRFGGHQMDKPGVDAHDFVVNGLQARKELLDAKVAQGTDAVGFALKSRQVQSHGSNSLLVEG